MLILFHLDKFSGVGRPGHTVDLFSDFWGTSVLSYTVVVLVYIPTIYYISPTSSPLKSLEIGSQLDFSSFACIYLLSFWVDRERCTEIERKKNRAPLSHSSSSKFPQWPGVGQAIAGSQELQQGLLDDWQRPSYCSHHCCLPGYVNRKLDWQWSWHSNPGTQIRDSGIPTCDFITRPNTYPLLGFYEEGRS